MGTSVTYTSISVLPRNLGHVSSVTVHTEVRLNFVQ